jgi:hypothetical protein
MYVLLCYEQSFARERRIAMRKMYIVGNKALVVAYDHNGEWRADLQLIGRDVQCVALDHLDPKQVYCGTFGQGLWRSGDSGTSWEHVGDEIIQEQVMSVAVSSQERFNGYGSVYVGTEPSAIFRSEDGGTNWRELESLRQLPSAPSWSFPPRPYTSHVRWITPDPLKLGRVFVAIEAGALVRSFDGGETWEDRRPDGPFDTHTLVMHRLAPDRLYSAAGDGFIQPGTGYVESVNGGDSWFRADDGLLHHYLWSVAVDPADPDTIVISAASGPVEAHDPVSAQSAIYCRSHGSPWRQVFAGLPDERGLLASVLATNQAEPGVFYMASNQGVYRSSDAGSTWEQVPIHLPANYEMGRAQALIVVDE